MLGLNLSRFDLVSIRLALACAQTGSLTQGAQQLHLAMAAASRRLRELEEALGSPLFERHARGLTPTAEGRALARHALALVQTLEQCGSEIRDLQQGIARHLRLHASTAAIIEFLPPLLARHVRQHPQIRIELEEQVSEAVVGALREGRADVGVFVEGPDARGLTPLPFRRDELVLVVPKGHPLAGTAALNFADALDQDWIGLNQGAALLVQQQQAALAAGRPLRLRMQVRSFDAVCHLVAAGLGVALLPRAAVLPVVKAMGLTMRPLADGWAQRRLLIATGVGVDAGDAAVAALMATLQQPSPIAKAARANRQ